MTYSTLPAFESSGGSEPGQLLSGLRVMGVNGAYQTGIVGAADVPHLDRIMDILNRRADQGLLHRAANAVGRSRSDIPRRRRDDLIVLDLAVLDLDPMTERPADRLRSPPTTAVPLGRLDVPWVVQLELAQRVLGLAIQLDRKSVV